MEDDGFCFTNEADSAATYHLRESVVKKMTELSDRCTGPLKDIADVIPKLLEIEPKKRLTAEQLVEKLKHLDTGELPPFDCEQPESFATSDIDASSTSADDSDSDFSSLDGFFTVTKPSQ